MLDWEDHWIRRTRVWNLDRPLSQQAMYKVPRKWQCENPVFFSGGTSWILLLLLIILRSEVHEVGWISSHILRWPSIPVTSPSVMRIEACCRVHEVDLMHLGSCYHCLSKLFLVYLDALWLATPPQKESNTKFIHRPGTEVGVFFQLLDSAVVTVVWAPLMGYFSD
jgi:hypothetical protein